MKKLDYDDKYFGSRGGEFELSLTICRSIKKEKKVESDNAHRVFSFRWVSVLSYRFTSIKFRKIYKFKQFQSLFYKL